MTTTAQTRRGRDLVPPDTFERLSKRLKDEHGLDTDIATRVVDQAAAFLVACGASSGPLSPSAAVDLGWHAFILHTRDYAAFCTAVAGDFIHHVPHDEPSAENDEEIQAVLDRTMTAISNAGLTVDEELWRVKGGVKCSQCHNGCADDPPPELKL